jgi:hypothetical protein
MLVRSKVRFACSVAVGGFLAISTAAGAADLGAPLPVKAVAAPAPPPSAWTFFLTPYFWTTSVDGTSTIRGRTLDVSASFIDIVENAQIPKDVFGLMGIFEARNGPWSLYADLAYLRLATDRSGTRVRSVNPLVGGTLTASASATLRMFIGEFAVAYEIFGSGAPAGTPGSATAIDLYGGGRVWWQEAEASLALTAGLAIGDLVISGGRAIARGGDVAWVDPFIGARVRHRFSPSTELVVKGDVGGFGAGSKFSWQAAGTLNWDFARSEHAVWTAVIGYRALYADYSQGGGRTLYEYDILMHGPVLGVTARF